MKNILSQISFLKIIFCLLCFFSVINLQSKPVAAVKPKTTVNVIDKDHKDKKEFKFGKKFSKKIQRLKKRIQKLNEKNKDRERATTTMTIGVVLLAIGIITILGLLVITPGYFSATIFLTLFFLGIISASSGLATTIIGATQYF